MNYTVKPGDTLQSIAKNVLGDASLVGYLASINKISAQNGGIVGGFFYPIKVGQVLNVGVAEVSSKYNYTPWIIGALLAAGALWYANRK